MIHYGRAIRTYYAKYHADTLFNQENKPIPMFFPFFFQRETNIVLDNEWYTMVVPTGHIMQTITQTHFFLPGKQTNTHSIGLAKLGLVLCFRI